MKKYFFQLLGIFLLSLSCGAAEFAPVVPGRALAFPRDHGAHPDFKTEWWYLTGHLRSDTGREYGFQWTVFRAGLRPPGQPTNLPQTSAWRAQEAFFGHLAVSDLAKQQFYFGESSARAALGLAGASEENFEVFLPGFQALVESDHLEITGKRDKIALQLEAPWPEDAVLNGQGGFSPKSADAKHASYYYSIPRMPVSGSLSLGKETFSVKGQAWMDHEFGSNQLSEEQSGWDWMGLTWGSKESLMIYRLRNAQDTSKDFLAGTFVDAAQAIHPLQGSDIVLKQGNTWSSPTGGRYPIQWKVSLPAYGIELDVLADIPEQELNTTASTQIPYWEGSVHFRGKRGAASLQGQGYLEMTGYANRFNLGL